MCSTETGRGRNPASLVGSDGMRGADLSMYRLSMYRATIQTGADACQARAGNWRRERDLNPRGGSTPPTRLAGKHLRPLGHPSETVHSTASRGDLTAVR